MQSFPSGGPQAERQITERVLGSIQAVNACLPQAPDVNDSGTAAATAGLLNSCSTLASAFSVFVLQMQTFACWIWAQLLASQTDITTLQDDVLTLQNEIAALPTMRTPGAITILEGAGAGAGATVSSSGNDTAGQITLNTGTGTGTGVLFTIANVTPFATAGILHLEPGNNATAGLVPPTFADENGATASFTGAIGDTNTFIWNYVVLGGT